MVQVWESNILICQRAEWPWSQNRIHLRQPIELSRRHSRVDMLTLPCMLAQHWQTLSFDVNVKRIWHHIRLRSLTAGAARPIRCIMPGLQYLWEACLSRDRCPRKISDSINDVSFHIDWCIKWFSLKMLNLGFLPGNEIIIDNRSTSFLNSHYADIFHI